jgi:hypothetical protein
MLKLRDVALMAGTPTTAILVLSDGFGAFGNIMFE